MSAAEVVYSFGVPYPDVVERERQQVVKMPAYRNGALVAPASGTLTVFKPDGTKMVDAAAITVSNSIAQYTLTTTHLASSIPFGEGYLQVWALTMPDSTVRHPRREMAVAKYALYPVVSDADLDGEYPTLAQQLGLNTLQAFIETAWGRILRKLIAQGKLSYRITSPDALFDWHQNLALFYAFKAAYRAQQADRWKELYEFHQTEARTSFAAMTFTEDTDDDGRPDSEARESSGTVVYVNAAPTRGQYGRTSSRW